MNCPNCGAPMQPVDNRDYLVCEHCTTFHFPHPNLDSVRVLDKCEEAGLACPVCQTPLVLGSVEGLRVLFCENCRGFLTSNDHFAQIVQNRRAKYQGPASKPTPLAEKELHRQLLCPGCRQAMDVYPYCGPGNVVIDTCSQCTLVWLDHGELAKIERYPSSKW